MRRANRGRWVGVLAVGSLMAVGIGRPSGGAPDGDSPASGDWPQWRGPARDGVSHETGLLGCWLRGGPPLLWRVTGMGRGWSSPIVAGGAIFITGDVGEELQILALDEEGKTRWRATNGAQWKTPRPGSRAACTYCGGMLYHLNAHGRLASLDAATGREAWAVDGLARFGARNITWGRAESVLVEGDAVFVTIAGGKALLVALDRRSGRTLWRAPPIEGEKAAYVSPVLARLAGHRAIVGYGSRHAFAVDAETGALLWKHRHPVEENVLGSTPVVIGSSVFITCSAENHAALYCLRLGGGAPEEAWRRDIMCGHGGLTFLGGALWAADARRRDGGLTRIDPESGEMVQFPSDLAPGATVAASGRLIHLGQTGEVSLLEPGPRGAKVVGRFSLTEAKKRDAWAHPVIAHGRLYLRYHDALSCYDLRARRTAGAESGAGSAAVGRAARGEPGHARSAGGGVRRGAGSVASRRTLWR